MSIDAFRQEIHTSNPGPSWYRLYQCARGLHGDEHEQACDLLLGEWARIQYIAGETKTCMGRPDDFFPPSHQGQGGGPKAKNAGEKHMVLGLYNAGSSPGDTTIIDGIPSVVLDYEIPLQGHSPQPGSAARRIWDDQKKWCEDNGYSKHGKIDLAIWDDANRRLLLTEAKDPRSQECGLRCALEIFVYLSVLKPALAAFRNETVARARDRMQRDIGQAWAIHPAILTFAGTASDGHLRSPSPAFRTILDRLSASLMADGYGSLLHLNGVPYPSTDLTRRDDQPGWWFGRTPVIRLVSGTP